MMINPINARMLSLIGQRGAYGKSLAELASKNDAIWGMTADQGALCGMAAFKKQFPDRFINFGISEQNAVGVAAGMANEGCIPFLAFQSAFATTRCADQVRVCMSYMNLNVKLVGLFSGFTVADCGPTHYSLQDIALYRTFPNMTIFSPADSSETVKVLEAAAQLVGPVYIRLGGNINIPIIYRNDYEFVPGKSVKLRDGERVCFMATGTMVANALIAADILKKDVGIDASVINFHTLKPFDVDAVKTALDNELIVTMEEHSLYGGLGSAVSMVVAESYSHARVLPIAAKDCHMHAAEYDYLMKENGLTPETVAEAVRCHLDLNG